MDGKSKETPIAKYLANLERRKSLFAGQSTAGSPSPTPGGFPFVSTIRRAPTGTQMKINFDDTFFSRNENESMLHVSPPSLTTKKRRLSLYCDDNENIETLQKKIADLERVLRQTQIELVDGQAACTKLNQANTETRRSYDEKIIGLEKSQEDFKLKCKNATERADSLEKQLLKIQRRDSDSTRDFQTQATTLLNKVSNLEATISGLQQKNMELNMKLTQQSISGERNTSQLQQKLDEAEKCCSKAKQDSDVLQGRLAEVELQLQNSKAELNEAKAEAKLNEGFRKDFEDAQAARENSNEDALALRESLNKFQNLFVLEQLKSQNLGEQCRKLQQENNILKTTVQREHLLKEQLLSTETEINVLKDQLREKGDVEGERNNLRNQIKAWIAVATKLDVSCRTPLDFDATFRKSQDMLLELKLENSNLKHITENNNQRIKSLDLEVSATKENVKVLSAEKEKINTDLRKLTRRMNLIVQDRDSLRGLMESYEKDFDDSSSLSDSSPLKLRISQLESLISDYEATIADDPSFKKSCEDCLRHIASMSVLQAELETTKSQHETLSRTLAEANQTLIEDPTTGFKIVSFGKNPSMLSIEARLKECIDENNSLKAKLKELENEENTIVAASDSSLLKEKNELEDRLKALERRHEILSESYDYETVQLQNACTKLFGYYVTLNRGGSDVPNQFRLQNINSMSPDETFIFQEGNAGEMLLLDTPILAHFQDDIERFLRQESSVPAFLSAVTIAYSQGVEFPTTSQLASVDAVAYHDNNSDTEGHESMQIMATESLAGSSTRREIQIEVEGEDDDEDVADEEVGSEDDEGGSEDVPSEDEEEVYEEEDDDDREDDDGDDDDVVMLD